MYQFRNLDRCYRLRVPPLAEGPSVVVLGVVSILCQCKTMMVKLRRKKVPIPTKQKRSIDDRFGKQEGDVRCGMT